MAKKKQATALSQSAISALRSASFDRNAFTLANDNLACYGEIKDLVEAIGGAWKRGPKHHAFAAGIDARTLVLAACDGGVIPATNPNDYFPTPSNVVEEMTTEEDFAGKWSARIGCNETDGKAVRYLEPNGGSGALAAVMAAALQPKDELVIVELNPILAASLRVRFPQATVVEADFLSFKPEAPFDVVLMNPPFAGKEYRKHVMHAYGMLNTRGILSAIVPTSFKDHGDDFVFSIAENGSWHDLGADRFEGTKTPTSILWMSNDPANKWRDEPHEGYSTFHAWNIATSIGNDGDEITRLRASTDFESACGRIANWVHGQLRDGATLRCDDSILSEVLRSLCGDYDIGGLEHLIPGAVTVEAVSPAEEPAEMATEAEIAAPVATVEEEPAMAPAAVEQMELLGV